MALPDAIASPELNAYVTCAACTPPSSFFSDVANAVTVPVISAAAIIRDTIVVFLVFIIAVILSSIAFLLK